MSTPMRDENAQREETEKTAGSPFVFTDDERPWPPRFWWLKRLSVAGVVLLLALVGVRWWWGAEAERRLAARIAQAQARGEPVTLEDFQALERDIPDERNAAYFYMRAAAAIPPFKPDPNTPPAAMLDNSTQRPDLLYPHAELEHYAETLWWFRQARWLTDVDWGVRLKAPALEVQLPHYQQHRELARAMSDVVIVQHRMGDDAAAIETLLDGWAQARAAGVNPSTLIGLLVMVAYKALYIDAIERIAPQLRVASADDADGAEYAAPCDHVEDLIALLLSEEHVRNCAVLGFQHERMTNLDSYEHAFSDPSWVGISPGVRTLISPVRPLLPLDVVFMHDCMDAAVSGIRADNRATARELSRPYVDSLDDLKGLEIPSRFLSSILLASTDRVTELYYRMIAMRRMAATALAIRLYEIDHGERPMALEDLVPQYLPAVPLDPFAPEDGDSDPWVVDAAGRRGRPIQYLRDGHPPLLYSVGSDGVDDGGRFELRPSGAVNMEVADLVFFLDGDRPRGR